MTIALIAAIALLVLFLVSIYNRLIKLRNHRENAFADIDVQLRQRHDLIPQLIGAVSGYMGHENEVLTRITNARAAAMGAVGIDAKIGAENALTSALGGLKVAVEAYPDLKANTNFLQLQEEIADIENKLASARRFFNSATKELNIAIESFPSNIVASSFGFKREKMFEISEADRAAHEAAPKIDFKA